MPCFEPVLMIRPGRPRAIMPGAKICVPWIDAPEVDAEHALPVLARPEHVAAGLDAGIVHQDVGAAEPLAHGALQRHDLLDAADIDGDGHDTRRAARRRRGDLRFGLGEPVAAEIGDADFHAERGEAHRRGKADAGRAAGDDGDDDRVTWRDVAREFS